MNKYLTLEVQVTRQAQQKQEVVKTYKIGPSSKFYNYLRLKYEGKQAYGFHSKYFCPEDTIDSNIQQQQQQILSCILTPWFYLGNHPDILKTKFKRVKPFNFCPHTLTTTLRECQICNSFFGCPKCHSEQAELSFNFDDDNMENEIENEGHQMIYGDQIQCGTCGYISKQNNGKKDLICQKCGCEIILSSDTAKTVNAGTCAICQEAIEVQLNKEVTNVAITDCGHGFHVYCFMQARARNPTCPICQKEKPVIVNLNIPVVQSLIINKIINVRKVVGHLGTQSNVAPGNQGPRKEDQNKNSQQQSESSSIRELITNISQESAITMLAQAQAFTDNLTQSQVQQWIQEQNDKTKELVNLLQTYGNNELTSYTIAQIMFFQKATGSIQIDSNHLARTYQELRTLHSDPDPIIYSSTL